MAVRITLKTIDYYKFRKMVVDGNRDDYAVCSKDVRTLCDSVQTILFRDEEFDDVSDRMRFDEICNCYKDILRNKRIDPADMRIKSGWWGDHRNAYSAGKLKASILRSTFIAKAQEWVTKHSSDYMTVREIPSKIDGPGLYVIKHKEHQCFQFVGRADRVFAACGELLKSAFEGTVQEPLAALLLICMASDWDFYFIPIDSSDGDGFLRVLENDLVLKHDSIWPHGLNFRLHIDTLFEVSEFRRSCLRHRWPPLDDVATVGAAIDFAQVRQSYSEFRNGSGAMEQNGDEQPKQQRTPRDTTDSPTPRESPAASKHSVTRKTRTPAPKVAAPTTTRSDKSVIQRPTSANRQRSSPTPRQPTTPRQQTTSRKQSIPRKQTTTKTPASDPAPSNEPQTPEPSTENIPAPCSPLPVSPTARKQTIPRKQTTSKTPASDPAPSIQPQTPVLDSPTESMLLPSSPSSASPVEADLVAVPPTVQALAALPNEDSGRRRNSSSSSRGTWTIDDGSASPRTFSPERSPTSSPAKASPKSPRRAFAV